MTWAEHKAKIRRFLRDPDGRLWDDPFLLRLWNDVQHEVNHAMGLMIDVEAVRGPPQFSCSYIHPWEWSYGDKTGKGFNALSPDDQSNFILCYTWEMEELAGYTSSTPSKSVCVHPWEQCVEPCEGPLLFNLPDHFESAKLVAYDNEPIEYRQVQGIMDNDPSYVTRTGDPFAYYRPSVGDHTFSLYPKPSTVIWPEMNDEGLVLFSDGDTIDSELGGVVLADGGEDLSDSGLAVDAISSTDNILFVYHKNTTDLASDDDESDLPDFISKYVVFGVLERAFMANTDGRLPTLAAYWSRRKEIGFKLIAKFLAKRTTDRVVKLRTPGCPAQIARRHPRLPDSYPAVYP